MGKKSEGYTDAEVKQDTARRFGKAADALAKIDERRRREGK
jgi:hypothetical protein